MAMGLEAQSEMSCWATPILEGGVLWGGEALRSDIMNASHLTLGVGSARA